jgi:hypothetical protein
MFDLIVLDFFFNLHRVHLKPSLFLNFYFESKDVF